MSFWRTLGKIGKAFGKVIVVPPAHEAMPFDGPAERLFPTRPPALPQQSPCPCPHCKEKRHAPR